MKTKTRSKPDLDKILQIKNKPKAEAALAFEKLEVLEEAGKLSAKDKRQLEKLMKKQVKKLVKKVKKKKE